MFRYMKKKTETAEERLARIDERNRKYQREHYNKLKKEGYKTVRVEISPDDIYLWNKYIIQGDESLTASVRRVMREKIDDLREQDVKAHLAEEEAMEADIKRGG